LGIGWIFFTVLGFLSGSVMYSYLIPKKVCGIDIRKVSPDSNPGGINVFREAGHGIGLTCIALDVLKAALPVFVAVRFGGIRGIQLLPVTIAPVLGHAFSPFLKFHGGKSIACAFGALLGLWPVSKMLVLLIISAVFFHFFVIIRPDSLCICVSMSFSLLATLFWEPSLPARFALLMIVAIVFFKTARNPNRGEYSITIGNHVFCRKSRENKFRRE
jgi:glycerol-3-phosphate acyltransferase PlsY